jgi:putative ABC transport system substrate-binding protein
MNKIIAAILTGSLLIFSCIVYATDNKLKVYKVLISQTVDHQALNITTEGIVAGLAQAGFVSGVNLELRVESAQGSSAMAAQIANKFVNQNPDVVAGVGTIAAQSFIKYANHKQIKLVFSSITDPQIAALEGVNITGVSNFTALEPQINLFREVLPALKSLGIIYNAGEVNSISVVHKLSKLCEQLNITLVKQSVTRTADVAQAAVKIASKVDAIFISNDNTALSSLQSIIKVAQQKNIPVFVSDTDAVKLGALAALGPNQFAIGKQTGAMIAKILQGTDINTIAPEYPHTNELFLNLPVAATLQLAIPTEVLRKATQIIKSNT